MPIEVKNGIARTESGSLARSTLTLELAVKNMHQLAEVELSEAIHMANLIPAKFLGLEKSLGSLE